MSNEPAWVGAVGADQAGAVDREAHRQVLDRDVMHHLVVAALQEGRIDGAERLLALGGEAGAKVTACCSAMPTSKVRLGNACCEQVEAGARRHGGGDGDDLVVLARFLDRLSPNTLV